MVAIEVALAVTLSTGAMLMARTLVALDHVDRGLRTDHLLTMKLQPSGSAGAVRAYWSEVLARVSSVPGVMSAATILHLPMSGRTWQGDLVVEGRPLASGATAPRTGWESISPGYFATAGVPIVSGRPFSASDGPDAPLVIAVDATVARLLFPAEAAVGKRISAGNATGNAFATIVAVVGPVRYSSLSEALAPEVYVPFAQQVVFANSLVVRTSVPPDAAASAVESEVRQVNRDVPITDIRTMDDRFATATDRPRMVSLILGAFAVTGILLAAVGIYGVVAYGVRQRERELGIRGALGADTWCLRRLVVREGLSFASLGLAAGVPAALVLAAAMRDLLFGVPVADPWSFGIVLAAVIAVATLASLVPAWRASAGNLADVLRR